MIKDILNFLKNISMFVLGSLIMRGYIYKKKVKNLENSIKKGQELQRDFNQINQEKDMRNDDDVLSGGV